MSVYGSDDQRKALVAALAEAQSELEGAKKNAANPHFRSKYATLAGVWEAWQDVGPKNGLVITQEVVDAKNHDGERSQGILLKTTLAHKEGAFTSSLSFWPAVKNDPQAYGSALTYARRYTLMALTGICPVEDDDGNAASKAVNQQADKQRFLDGLAKYKDDKAKLTVIANEAHKAGLYDVAAQADARIKELG